MARIRLFDFYAALLTKLGPSFVELQYAVIVSHLTTEIIVGPLGRPVRTRYEGQLVRTLVWTLLRDLVGERMLSEQGQIGAIRELATVHLKRGPASMPGSTAPTDAVLVTVLSEVARLLRQLGNAPPPMQDAVAEPLVTLLAHPSHTVRVNTAWALRCCFSTPLRLPKTILVAIKLLRRDLTALLTPRRRRCLTWRLRGEARRIAGTEVEVAWMVLAALMALGPNFVRPQLWPCPLAERAPEAREQGHDGGAWACGVGIFAPGERVWCRPVFPQVSFGDPHDARRRPLEAVLSDALAFANSFANPAVQDALGLSDAAGGPAAEHTGSRTAALRPRGAPAAGRVAYGVIFIEIGGDELEEDGKVEKEQDLPNRDSVEVAIDNLARLSNAEYHLEEPPPANTSVVDTTIELFAQLLPPQDHTSAVKILILLDPLNYWPERGYLYQWAYSSSPSLLTLCSGRIREPAGNDIAVIILEDALVDLDLAPARQLANFAGPGTTLLTGQIKLLVDEVVNNRIRTSAPGNDPHPVVHLWALNALRRVMHAASLVYSSFVSSKLGIKVYLMESYERRGGTLLNPNLSGDCPAYYPVVCQITDAVITILGSDMQESS
ncbi:hypothetical protein B0H12DRAFT_1224594 [Mycena haematopus]|nr:hypothetical protein B0H12DRAFT_1224594 [Mycena haematopus]